MAPGCEAPLCHLIECNSCDWLGPPDVRQGLASSFFIHSRFQLSLSMSIHLMKIDPCDWALPPDVRQGSALPQPGSLPRGFAPGLGLPSEELSPLIKLILGKGLCPRM